MALLAMALHLLWLYLLQYGSTYLYNWQVATLIEGQKDPLFLETRQIALGTIVVGIPGSGKTWAMKQAACM